MVSRHALRSVILQSLYELDFYHFIGDTSIEIIDKTLENNINFISQKESIFFIKKIYKGILDNIIEIDLFISNQSPKVSIKNLSIVDRNILRIGIYEGLYTKETPFKVVVDESIKLAKKYSGEGAIRFINGVLGSILLLEKNEK